MIDMWIAPELTLLERYKIAMRTKFFYFLWQRLLEKTDYPLQRYCISPEALDITRIIVDSYVCLLLLHPDHMGEGVRYPFIPWLHSTEACEHLFAECRKLVKDFKI